ncbi:hypothetical protein HDG40_005669 [Paraburkholderia sp. JPY158]|uniref:Uncharacterized protein n=1 Tax=Paraburkholderia atlantica TaxID=2654982 RepID=A0A7W8QBY6_PARAM|nr:hypothetical protein [Paraburkholderia atlantica]
MRRILAAAGMVWTEVSYWAHIIRPLLPLLYLPVGAAAVGFVIGRLIRGRPYIGRHAGRTSC